MSKTSFTPSRTKIKVIGMGGAGCNAITRMVPLARLMDGQIAALKHWAKGRARTAAADHTAPGKSTRRISSLN